jgi:hypothetical protein
MAGCQTAYYLVHSPSDAGFEVEKLLFCGQKTLG